MFFNSYLISKHQKRDLVDIFYQKIVNVSRNKVFYTKLNIPDTLDGRYDLLALFSIFIIGGEILKGFSFAMILGVIVGTYSSIFVASPILRYLKVSSRTLEKKEENIVP